MRCKLVLSGRDLPRLARVKEHCLEDQNTKLLTSDILILPFDMKNTKEHQENHNAVIRYFDRASPIFPLKRFLRGRRSHRKNTRLPKELLRP